MREPVEDYAHTDQGLLVTQKQNHANIGVQYSATMNARDLPSRMRTSFICIVAPINTTGKCDCSFFGKAHPLQKKLAVHVLDGIETKASAARGLTHHPSTNQSVGWNGSSIHAKSSLTSCAYLLVRLGAGSQPITRVDQSWLVGDVANKSHICSKQVVIVSELFVYVRRPSLVPIPYNLVYSPLLCTVIPINTCGMAAIT